MRGGNQHPLTLGLILLACALFVEPSGQAFGQSTSDDPPLPERSSPRESGISREREEDPGETDEDKGPRVDGFRTDHPDAPPPLFFRGIRDWIQSDDPDGSEGPRAGISRSRPRSDPRVNIRSPDPDTANFPNSSFTIPQGRVYLETSPVSFYGPSPASGRIYNWEFLFRYGITDALEFRIFSSGYTNQYTNQPTTGFSPLAFDLKVHLWDENLKYLIPAVGLEVYIETQMGSPRFNQGTQPSINILFDHTLPWGFQLEWNAGIAGNLNARGQLYYELALAWSIQHDITENTAAFVHSYVNNPSLPRFGQSDIIGLGDDIVIGTGGVWTPTDRIAFFGSYNWGVTKDAPREIILFGTAVAF